MLTEGGPASINAGEWAARKFPVGKIFRVGGATEKGVVCIVFTSSVAVYGFAPPNTDESGAINPFNEYGRTKCDAEQVYREW